MTQQTQNSTALNSVSSVHHYVGYVTDAVLVTPKPEKDQKSEPVPYFKVSASLHNGRTAKKHLKYAYATLIATEEVQDIVDDVMKQVNNMKATAEDGEKVSIKCKFIVRDVTANPYISKDNKARVNWGGYLTALEVLNDTSDAS